MTWWQQQHWPPAVATWYCSPQDVAHHSERMCRPWRLPPTPHWQRTNRDGLISMQELSWKTSRWKRLANGLSITLSRWQVVNSWTTRRKVTRKSQSSKRGLLCKLTIDNYRDRGRAKTILLRSLFFIILQRINVSPQSNTEYHRVLFFWFQID